MLRAEFDSQEHGAPCSDCGKSDVILTHGLYDDSEPFAMVVSRLSPHSKGPSAGEASMDIILADPDTGEPAEAFSLRVHAIEGQYAASFVDAPDGLTRDKALAHPRKDDAFAVFDCLLGNDAVLRRFLDRPGYDA